MLVSFREQRWQGKTRETVRRKKRWEGEGTPPAASHWGTVEFIQQIPISSSFNRGQKIHLCPFGGVGKIHWRRDGLPTSVFLGFSLAQLVKNAPAMWETWVRSLGWEDFLEKGKVTQSSILAWRIPWGPCVHGVSKSRIRLSKFHFHFSQGLLSSVKY